MSRERGYDQITPEDYLDNEGIEYRHTSGSNGPQLNVKTCPDTSCGSDNWKVYLGAETGFGNCFRCGRSYNLWSFAGAHLGTDDPKSIGAQFDEMAKAQGWRPKRVRRDAPAPVFDGELTLPRSIELPTEDGRTLSYLDQRGISNDLTRHFHLRYCHDGAFAYKKEDGTDRLMPFSGRVLIPVFDLEGTLVTFQGRDITGEAEKKYLFPPRLPGTARFLYNGHNAWRTKPSHIVMGEGAFDVIAIQRALNKDRAFAGIIPVGSFGKTLSLSSSTGPCQLDSLLTLRKRGLQIITILWDGEAEALTSACTAARELTRHQFQVRIAFMPKGKDPAEVSPATVLKSIRSARPYSNAFALKLKIRNPYR